MRDTGRSDVLVAAGRQRLAHRRVASIPAKPLPPKQSVESQQKRIRLPRTRMNVTVAALLWAAHLGVVALLGTNSRGPLLSDAIQFALGVVMIYSAVQASGRSEGLARSFWGLVAVAYS